jgi:hypothetical protein
MKIEKAGDPVFANIDQALVGRIISRSKENSKATEPAVDGAINPETDNTNGYDLPHIYLPDSFPALKVAAAVAGFLMLMMLLFRRGGKK